MFLRDNAAANMMIYSDDDGIGGSACSGVDNDNYK